MEFEQKTKGNMDELTCSFPSWTQIIGLDSNDFLTRFRKLISEQLWLSQYSKSISSVGSAAYLHFLHYYHSSSRVDVASAAARGTVSGTALFFHRTQKYDTFNSFSICASALSATCTTIGNPATFCCRKTNVDGDCTPCCR